MGIDSVGKLTFRKMESTALDSGKIDATEAQALGEAAKKEDPVVARQVLYGDAFENTDARAAYAKAAGITEKIAPSPLAGQAVGAATISRTLGDQKGYENPLQAVAAARLAGVANAAVVSNGGRYYAVEVNKSVPGAQSSAAGKAFGLGPKDETAIKTARTNLANARAEDPPDGAKINKLQQELASKIYGLPPSSFNPIRRNEDRVATTMGKDGVPTGINIQNGLKDASNGDVGTHAQVGTEGSKAEGFNPNAGTAISLDGGMLEGKTKNSSTDNMVGVLEHEATHLEDTEEAKGLIGKWGGDFNANPDGFKGWMGKQEKAGNITHAQALRVGQIIDPRKGNADTELHAHMSTAIDAIRNGAPDVAKEQMKDYTASAQNPDLLAENHVLADAAKAYKTMTKDQKAQFKEALAAAGDIFKNFDPEKGTYLKKPIKDI